MATIIGYIIIKENKKRHGRQSTIFSDFQCFKIIMASEKATI
jgi:hypothetical protein